MKFNRRCPIGGSFWPRGIYSVVNHARITTGQTSVCATEPVRAAGCPGGFYTAGLQLGSGAVVLPVICAHQGLTWAAGLLYPAFCIGAILGNSLSPLILQRAGQLRHLLMAAISATAAALVVCNAAVPWTGVGVAAVFLATTGAGGVVTGVSSVAYTDMISSMLPAVRRGELLLTQGAAGSVLATGVTLVIVPMLAHGNEMARYHDLLWLGAAGLVCSGIAALFVGPMRSVSVTTATRMPLREIYWMGFAIARSQPWFRRYMTTYLLFVPISLGTTFFSLRAAQSNGSLHVLVILSSIGLVVGSMLWRPPVRGAWPAAGQRTAQRRCCAAVHGGRVVWAVGSRLGVRHGVPAGYGGRSNGGRRIDIVDQRPRARAVPRHPDLRWVDLGRRRSHRAGSCARRNCPKACHHLAGCRRADTGRNRRGGESARTDTNRGDGGHEPASSDLASLPPGHS